MVRINSFVDSLAMTLLPLRIGRFHHLAEANEQCGPAIAVSAVDHGYERAFG
jgi:hypothetical protein